MTSKVRNFAPLAGADTRPETSRARSILRYAHESAAGFALAFANVRKQRGAQRGAPTDEEQDLLRALIVFSAAGLDAALKQLIREALPTLVRCNEAVRTEFEKFAYRQIKGDDDVSDAREGAKLLARILTSENPREKLIEEYVLDLTGASLQSAEQVFKAASALGVTLEETKRRSKELSDVFKVRNKIIHELDINFDHANRNREGRRRDDAIKQANTLLETGEAILNCVTRALPAP